MRKNVVQMKQIVEKMNLKNLTPDVELSDKAVECALFGSEKNSENDMPRTVQIFSSASNRLEYCHGRYSR